MGKQLNLLEDGIPKLFFKYLFNAIAGALTLAAYVLADTVFIGWGVGADGLASLSISIPFYSFCVAAGLLFGIGGATASSVCKGEGDLEKANRYFSLAVTGIAIFIVVFTITGLIFFEPLLRFFGAEDSIYPLVETYSRVVLLGGSSFVCFHFLQVFVRNDGNPKLPMIAAVISGILNIILDIIFIFPLQWGMFGAAFATVLSTYVSVFVLLFHFKNKNCTLKYKIPKNVKAYDVLRIIKNGMTNGLIELLGGVVILMFNRQLMRYLGVVGVTAYGIITNANYVVLAVFNGTSQAVQPIASVNLGAGKLNRIKKLAVYGFGFVLSWSLLVTLLGAIYPEQIVSMFLAKPSLQVMEIGRRAVTISFFAYPMAAINIMCSTLLQSMEFSKLSVIISLFRGIIFVIIGMYMLPLLFGVDKIWYTVAAAETVTLLISCYYIIKVERQVGINTY